MPEKKTKKIPVIRVILLGLILYVAVRFVIGDGREYDYVEDTAVYGTQEANPIYGQNVLKGDDNSLYIVYNSDRHVETYKGNLESKEYMKQNHLNMYDMNVIGNTVYALEGASPDEGYRLVSFDLTNQEEVTRLVEKPNTEKNVLMDLSNLLVMNDTCYFLCEGMEQFAKDDDMFISFNLTTGEEKIIDAPPIREYFIDNETVYFIGSKDMKLYSMSLEGGEVTKLSPFETIHAFMYEGRIYYEGRIPFGKILMSMNPDGTNHKMHKFIDLGYNTTAFENGKLYTYDDEIISCINLADGVSTEWEINIREQVISKITSYYAEYIDTSVPIEEISIEPSELTVSNGHAYFIPKCIIGEVIVQEAFIMDLETKEIYLLNEYFGVGPEIEYKPVVK